MKYLFLRIYHYFLRSITSNWFVSRLMVFLQEHWQVIKLAQIRLWKTVSTIANVRYIPLTFDEQRFKEIAKKKPDGKFDVDRALCYLDLLSVAYNYLILFQRKRFDSLSVYKRIGTHILIFVPRSCRDVLFKQYFIVCRGDLSTLDFYNSFQFEQVPYRMYDLSVEPGNHNTNHVLPESFVCKGMSDLWDRHKKEFFQWLHQERINNATSISICGHGTGGFLSSMICLELYSLFRKQGCNENLLQQKIMMYNFSEQRFGNNAFYDMFQGVHRWTINNVNDPCVSGQLSQFENLNRTFYYGRHRTNVVQLDVEYVNINENFLLKAYYTGLKTTEKDKRLVHNYGYKLVS
jgi:hypothetical protein